MEKKKLIKTLRERQQKLINAAKRLGEIIKEIREEKKEKKKK